MPENKIKLELNPGVELQNTETPGICQAVVLERQKRFELSWDRFQRLYRCAEFISARLEQNARILDVGGFDGALALFLPGWTVDVLDPISTGASALEMPECRYDAVVAIDALEHVEPEQRENFLAKITDCAAKFCFLNFPAPRTLEAQKLVYELTENPLVKEHVIWELPDGKELSKQLSDLGFYTELIEHTSLAQWLSQYLLQSLAPEAAAKANSELLFRHLDDPVGIALYDLLLAAKN